VLLLLQCGIVKFVGEIVVLRVVPIVDGRYLDDPK
jgi:hypothetical protein